MKLFKYSMMQKAWEKKNKIKRKTKVKANEKMQKESKYTIFWIMWYMLHIYAKYIGQRIKNNKK